MLDVNLGGSVFFVCVCVCFVFFWCPLLRGRPNGSRYTGYVLLMCVQDVLIGDGMIGQFYCIDLE